MSTPPRPRPAFNPVPPRDLRKSYEELQAKHGPNWGLQPMDMAPESRAMRDEIDRRHRDTILAEWDRRGAEPPTLGGIVVSPELAKHLNLQAKKSKEETDVDAAR